VQPFDPGDYRRRVLAGVHARGGADDSDPFEIYDIPLDDVEALTDAEVAARLRQVWAFWQKSRDHPRYRGVVLSMLAVHAELSGLLADRASRLALRDRVAAARAAREDERFAEVDAAVARLVERFGGLPEDKVAGLTALAAARGIDADALARRTRRYRRLPAGAPERAAARREVPAHVLRQVRADLDELGRITGTPAPASLYELLGAPPGAGAAELRRRRDDMAADNRARRPDRRRALVDDLLAAAGALLIDGDQRAYLDALAAAAADRLRPRVAAAVLVEDRLLPEHYAAFVAEAAAAGCDPARARAVVDALAREHGVEPPAAGAATTGTGTGTTAGTGTARTRQAYGAGAGSGGAGAGRQRPGDGYGGHSGYDGHDDPTWPPRARSAPGPASAAGPAQAGGDWRAALSLARAALRAGRPVEASGHVASARELAGETLPPIRAIGDEAEAAIRAASGAWERIVAVLAEDRHAEALRLAEEAARIAADVPGPGGRLVAEVLHACRERLTEADALVARARAAAAPAQRDALVAQALRLVADHAEARAMLAEAVADVAAPPRSAADVIRPATDMRIDRGMLCWTWPDGCTEMMVVWRRDAPPLAADDAAGQGRRKVTNTRYELDHGVRLPAERPLHVAVFACLRERGRLVVASTAAPSARLVLVGAADPDATRAPSA
jgi:hypothetical protein